MTATRITTSDGLSLEAAWTRPGDPDRVLVLCHPHPQQGGTMNAPLIAALARHLSAAGWAVLRFNYRGIGSSQGQSSGGTGEVSDVAAAVDAAAAAHPDLSLDLVGWSFGAATALRWQARTASALRYVGIAPPVASQYTPPLPPPEGLAATTRTFIIGDRDQFTTTDDLGAYARSIGAGLEVIKGSDHFFHFRDAKVAELVAGALREV